MVRMLTTLFLLPLKVAPFEAPPLFAHERFEPDGSAPAVAGGGEEGAPLFSYECMGEDHEEGEQVEHHPTEKHHTGGNAYDVEGYDLNDPTLEKFPLTREEIFDTVRKIESGLDEDRPSFEAAPSSPIISPGRRQSNEFDSQILSTSPSASPVVPRAVKRLILPGVPQGSETPERSASQISLQSILEEDGTDGDSEDAQLPRSRQRNSSLRKSFASDEDDGVEMRSKTGKSSLSGAITISGAVIPDLVGGMADEMLNGSDQTQNSERSNTKSKTGIAGGVKANASYQPSNVESPKIVVQSTEASVPIPSDLQQTTSGADIDTGSIDAVQKLNPTDNGESQINGYVKDALGTAWVAVNQCGKVICRDPDVNKMRKVTMNTSGTFDHCVGESENIVGKVTTSAYDQLENAIGDEETHDEETISTRDRPGQRSMEIVDDMGRPDTDAVNRVGLPTAEAESGVRKAATHIFDQAPVGAVEEVGKPAASLFVLAERSTTNVVEQRGASIRDDDAANPKTGETDALRGAKTTETRAQSSDVPQLASSALVNAWQFGGAWLMTFAGLVIVDWVGDMIRRLLAGRHQK
jgi:hypothetical protein